MKKKTVKVIKDRKPLIAYRGIRVTNKKSGYHGYKVAQGLYWEK
jgi:hypothetical protein